MEAAKSGEARSSLVQVFGRGERELSAFFVLDENRAPFGPGQAIGGLDDPAHQVPVGLQGHQFLAQFQNLLEQIFFTAQIPDQMTKIVRQQRLVDR